MFRLLACRLTVVITKPLTSGLRRCYMSAACLTCDLELSFNHDPRSIQSRGRRTALLSSYDQVCLLDDLKWEGSQCEKKLQTKGRREVEREWQRKGEKEGGEEVRQWVRKHLYCSTVKLQQEIVFTKNRTVNRVAFMRLFLRVPKLKIDTIFQIFNWQHFQIHTVSRDSTAHSWNSTNKLKNIILHNVTRENNRFNYRIKVDICEESLNKSSNVNPERVQTQDVWHFTVQT